MGAISDAIERGRAVLQARKQEEERQEVMIKTKVEAIKDAIHQKVLLLVPEDLHKYTQPIGVMSYIHYFGTDYSERCFYWAESIQVIGNRHRMPVVLRFDVSDLNSRSYSGDTIEQRLLALDLEKLNLSFYTEHDRLPIAIARPMVDEESEAGWRWNYGSPLNVDDTLDVALAMADEMSDETMPGFLIQFEEVMPASASSEDEPPAEENDVNIRTPEDYDFWERWFRSCMGKKHGQDEDLNAMTGVVLSDIAMSLRMISISLIALENRK